MPFGTGISRQPRAVEFEHAAGVADVNQPGARMLHHAGVVGLRAVVVRAHTLRNGVPVSRGKPRLTPIRSAESASEADQAMARQRPQSSQREQWERAATDS